MGFEIPARPFEERDYQRFGERLQECVQALGLVEFTQKGIAGDAPKVSPSIFRSLLDAAKESGANAVINVRLSTGTYQQQGSQWQVTYIIAYGDAVVLSE